MSKTLSHPDAMTDDEVRAFYREASDKNKAIEILADCNACAPNDIIALLRDSGEISGLPSKNAKKPTRRDQLIDLADRGYTLGGAAQELGISYNAVSTMASRFGIKFAHQRDHSAPKTPRKSSPPNAKGPSAPTNTAATPDHSVTVPIDFVQTLTQILSCLASDNVIECGARPGELAVIYARANNKYRLRLEKII